MSNAAELLIDTWVKCGVDMIHGLPGDGINGIMEAAEPISHKLRSFAYTRALRRLRETLQSLQHRCITGVSLCGCGR